VLIFALFFAANGFGGGVGTIAAPQVFASTGLAKSLSLQFSLFGFLVGLVAVILGSFLIDRVSRRWFGVVTCLGAFAGSACMGLYGKGHPGTLITAYLLFTAFTWIGPGTLAWVWQGELFPTHLRGVGTGATQAAVRLAIAANAYLVPPLLVAYGLKAILIFACAYLVCVGLLLGFKFFDTTGQDLESAADEPAGSAAVAAPVAA
jgi:putative MFS transporter